MQYKKWELLISDLFKDIGQDVGWCCLRARKS